MSHKVIFFFCIVFCLPFSTKAADIEFTRNELSSVKAKAKAKNRPYFAYFTANWCMPCRLMDENTWTNSEVQNYINSNYYAAKIDVDNFDGIILKDQFKVEAFPTIILFAPNGKFLKRLEGGQSASNLLYELKKYDNYSDKTGASPSPTPTNTTTSTTTDVPPPPIQKFDPVASGDGLYRFTVSRQASEGFSVQVGVYADYENVLREVERFQLLFDEPILVHIDKLKDRTVYRILIGDFNRIERAGKYKDKILAKGIAQAFVKDLSTLK